jgi:hypothetical protein
VADAGPRVAAAPLSGPGTVRNVGEQLLPLFGWRWSVT